MLLLFIELAHQLPVFHLVVVVGLTLIFSICINHNVTLGDINVIYLKLNNYNKYDNQVALLLLNQREKKNNLKLRVGSLLSYSLRRPRSI